jgi:ketosteroid isomerase-like protein
MTTAETDISELLERRSEAIRAKDLERLLSFYAPDVVYFDLVPPLQYVGIAALRGRFEHWFAGWDGPIRQEVHDLHVQAGGDTAVAAMLIRSGGTRRDGTEAAFWVRATSACRRAGDTWAITHEHISLPVDMATARAVLDLEP